MTHRFPLSRSTSVHVDDHELHRHLVVPGHPPGIVMFADVDGRGSGDAPIAHALEARGIATLRVALVADDGRDHGGDEIQLLADCIVDSIDWLRADANLRDLPLGLFGSDSFKAAVLTAAARRPAVIDAIVCGNGHPDDSGAAAEAARLVGDWFFAQFKVAREATSRRGLGDPAC